MNEELRKIARKLVRDLEDLGKNAEAAIQDLEDYVSTLSGFLFCKFQEIGKVLKKSADIKIRQTWNESIDELQKNLERLKLQDPILEMGGMGEEIWEGIDPDRYVKELREGDNGGNNSTNEEGSSRTE